MSIYVEECREECNFISISFRKTLLLRKDRQKIEKNLVEII